MIEFSKNEIINLIIAFIVLTIAFAISTVGLNLHGFVSILPIIMIGVGIGGLLHEIGHKYAAMKFGYRSEYKLWPLGLLIALLSSFIGIVIAIPGEAHIYAEDLADDITGKIKIAGPMANMILGLLYLLIAALIYPTVPYSRIFELIYLTCTVGFSVNAFLATFNLLPFYTLDGTKILKWNWKIWITIFVIAGAMTLFSISIGAENMVKFIIEMWM